MLVMQSTQVSDVQGTTFTESKMKTKDRSSYNNDEFVIVKWIFSENLKRSEIIEGKEKEENTYFLTNYIFVFHTVRSKLKKTF